MKKLSIKRRGVNARRPFRALNSVVDLVGKDVEVMDESTMAEAEVVEVSVDKVGDVTLNLSNGDEVVIDEVEAKELISTGEVEHAEDEIVPEVNSDPEPESVAEDFEVTREVVDADGVAQEVTTGVEATSESDAITKIELLDSRRKRNSRGYRANRKLNSDAAGDRVVDLGVNDEFTARISVKGGKLDSIQMKKVNDLDDKFVPVKVDAIGTEVKMDELEGVLNSAAESYRKMNSDKSQCSEYKVARVADCNGKKVRKIASVTAPSIDEAIEAVKADDKSKEIDADGYEELVDKEPVSTVVINSDVEEMIEDPNPEPEPTMDPAPEMSPEPEPTPADPAPAMDPEPEGDEIDRESNSAKGVAAFCKRKYGIDI